MSRMEKIADLVRGELSGLCPELSVKAKDNLCSVVDITGSFDPRETWQNGIFENSRYFRFMITSSERWYSEGDKISIELISCHGVPKFRRFGSIVPIKVVQKLKDWFVQANDELTQR